MADAFVSAGDVERAERTLQRWESERPGSRSHIQQAAWHVPLPWFALFEDGERRGRGAGVGPGGPADLRTTMAKARRRVSRAVGIQELMDDTEMVVAVEELRAWLHSFDPDSLVQLDYGGLTRAIPFEDLVADHSRGGLGGAGRAGSERPGSFQRVVPHVERALVGSAG